MGVLSPSTLPRWPPPSPYSTGSQKHLREVFEGGREEGDDYVRLFNTKGSKTNTKYDEQLRAL